MKKPALILALLLTLLGTSIAGAAGRTRTARRTETGPTFSNEVSRLFQQHCQSCHHPGDVAPFSLMTYRDALPFAASIRSMTQTRQMPPWKPAPGCGEFQQSRGMSAAEINLIARWVEGGAPEGDRALLPPPLVFENGWSLGQPDLVLRMSEPYTPAGSEDIYRCFPMRTAMGADRYVSAIDIRPGDRESVHHVIAFLDTSGESERLDAADPGPGYTCFGGPGFLPASGALGLGGWAPGARPIRLPQSTGIPLPAGVRVVLQVHYHSQHGRPLPDQTEIGIYLTENRPEKLLYTLPIINQSFVLPPGSSDHEVKATLPIAVPVPIHVVSIAPHMHLLGRSMKVEATTPRGEKVCLINIEDWEFKWQGQYHFKTPLAIPQGSALSLTARYDNSSANPRNPNSPPKEVRWGEATTDEMCIAFVSFTVD